MSTSKEHDSSWMILIVRFIFIAIEQTHLLRIDTKLSKTNMAPFSNTPDEKYVHVFIFACLLLACFCVCFWLNLFLCLFSFLLLSVWVCFQVALPLKKKCVWIYVHFLEVFFCSGAVIKTSKRESRKKKIVLVRKIWWQIWKEETYYTAAYLVLSGWPIQTLASESWTTVLSDYSVRTGIVGRLG